MLFGQSFLARNVRLGLLAGLLAVAALPSIKLPALAGASEVNAWWPKAGVSITGVQPFKAVLTDRAVGDYRMTWRVDGGTETAMYDSYQDYPHKEAMVDVSGWTWKGEGPYAITYTAYSADGSQLDTQTVNFSIRDGVAAASAAPAAAVATPAATVAAPVKAAAAAAVGKVAALPGHFFADPESPAAKQAAAWRSSRPADAAAMDKIAAGGAATWFGGWNADVRGDVDKLVDRAASSGSTPVLVAYNIPGRDCGSYSAGGAPSGAYASWISAFATGLGGRSAVVVLEPDALAQVTCLSSNDQAQRYQLLSSAVSTIKSTDNRARVYLDAGHAGWVDASEMASRLEKAGVTNADGFSLNVSSFTSLPDSEAYGHAIASKTGGKHFVIDTSRNGRGEAPGNEWCNPSGRGLGVRPTTATNDSLADAFLWIKTPGESDGTCNGGPSAGTWWPDYALGLADRASS